MAGGGDGPARHPRIQRQGRQRQLEASGVRAQLQGHGLKRLLVIVVHEAERAAIGGQGGGGVDHRIPQVVEDVGHVVAPTEDPAAPRHAEPVQPQQLAVFGAGVDADEQRPGRPPAVRVGRRRRAHVIPAGGDVRDLRRAVRTPAAHASIQIASIILFLHPTGDRYLPRVRVCSALLDFSPRDLI